MMLVSWKVFVLNDLKFEWLNSLGVGETWKVSNILTNLKWGGGCSALENNCVQDSLKFEANHNIGQN